MANKFSPALILNEIKDIYIRKNFESLKNYFAEQNQFLDFKFFEIEFTEAQANRKVAHGLTVVPADVVVTKITGAQVDFNFGLFDTTNIDITSYGPCKVRFYVGRYWNDKSNASANKADIMTFNAGSVVTSSSSSDSTEELMLKDASMGVVTINLPSATVSSGKTLVIMKTDSSLNAVLINAGSSGLLDGITSLELINQYDCITIKSNGKTWFSVAKKIKKESAIFLTSSTWSQTAGTWVTIPLASSDDSTKYPVASSTIVIRKKARYKFTLQQDVFGNGESFRLGYTINGGAEQSHSQNHTIDNNASGSWPQFTDFYSVNLNKGDVIRARGIIATNTRTGSYGRVVLEEID